MLNKQNGTGNDSLSKRKFPAFSVLMAVYREEKPNYLNEALLSIENQTVKPQEIVLVEDGVLTESLNKVIQHHKDLLGDQLKVIEKKKNEGLGLSLSVGARYVDTNWIARMDTDDISINNRFELQLKKIVDNKKLALIGGQVDEFSDNLDNVVGKRYVPTSQAEILNFLKWRNPFNHPTVMIRKDALEAVGGYQGNGKLEDYFLWSKLIIAGYDVENLSEILVHMRVDNGMYGRRGDWQNLKEIIALKKLLRKHKLIGFWEEVFGMFVLIANTIIPEGMRKFLYQHILHK